MIVPNRIFLKKYPCHIADKSAFLKKNEPGFVYVLNDLVVVTKQMKDNSEKMRKNSSLNETEVSSKNGIHFNCLLKLLFFNYIYFCFSVIKF